MALERPALNRPIKRAVGAGWDLSTQYSKAAEEFISKNPKALSALGLTGEKIRALFPHLSKSKRTLIEASFSVLAMHAPDAPIERKNFRKELIRHGLTGAHKSHFDEIFAHLEATGLLKRKPLGSKSFVSPRNPFYSE